MRRVLLTIALLTLPAVAQEQPKPPEPKPADKIVQKLIPLKYAEPQAVMQLISLFPVKIAMNTEMRVLALSGTEAAVDTAVQAIKELDVPAAAQKNVELTVYYLSGTDAADASGGPPPPELAGVVTQLKNTFAFKQYRLMDVLRVRTRPGQSAETDGMTGSVDTGTSKQAIFTRFKIRSASVSPDGGTVHIDGLQSNSRVPIVMGANTQIGYSDISMNTDIDVKEGQKTVVGRMGLDRDKALFLVLTTQVVQ